MEKKEKVQFTHFDEQGNAWMVDVGAKADTVREAAARGSIHMSRECLEMVTAGKIKKGDVLGGLPWNVRYFGNFSSWVCL